MVTNFHICLERTVHPSLVFQFLLSKIARTLLLELRFLKSYHWYTKPAKGKESGGFCNRPAAVDGDMGDVARMEVVRKKNYSTCISKVELNMSQVDMTAQT